MPPDERLRRPTPERTAPLRGGRPGPDRRARPRAAEPEPGSGGDPPAPDAGSGAERAGDVLRRAVDLGYRVVDDYVRQGQRAARLMNERAYGLEAARDDLVDLSTRMLRHASDFWELWLTGLGQSLGGVAPPRDPPPPASAFGATPMTAPAAREAASEEEPPEPRSRAAPHRVPARPLRIELATSRPVEVTADLTGRNACGPFSVLELRSPDPSLPRLDQARASGGSDGAPLQIALRIPDDHPPGTYSGVIVDLATSLPVGTLYVRIPVGEAGDDPRSHDG